MDRQTHSRLVRNFDDIKSWKTDDGYKISAAYLLDKAGFKGRIDAETGMTTWKHQPLVLVNHKAQRTSDLIRYQDKITDRIYDIFGINLEREPEILP